MENDEYITDTMKRFKLVDMRKKYPELIQEAEQKQISYREFLINLLRAEDEGKNTADENVFCIMPDLST